MPVKKTVHKKTAPKKAAVKTPKPVTIPVVGNCKGKGCCKGVFPIKLLLLITAFVLSLLALIFVSKDWKINITENGGKDNMSIIKEILKTDTYKEQQNAIIQQLSDTINQ